jgi:formamidopyrimidine-DNA glycosylase
MRVLTPDLRALVQAIYIDRAHEHLTWCRQLLAANGPCEALNMHLRMNGEHRFVYDEEHLTEVLKDFGFRVRRVRYNWSPVRELRYLDLRDFGLSMFLEAVKANA